MVSSRSNSLRTEDNNNQDNIKNLSFPNAVEERKPSSSNWSNSGPSSLNSVSPEGEEVITTSGNTLGRGEEEERYEAFGSVNDADQSSPSPSVSPTSGIHSNKNPRSPVSALSARNSWCRTSLGRSPAGTNRMRLGSNALASQLYRSSSFNSSGRGSICDTAEDVYSDVSLEDDVIDLNHRVQMIQEQMHALVDTQSAGEERYVRVKQDNATLQARILMLEEAARDAEARAEEKLQSEQRRHRDSIARFEREKQLQLENYAIKLEAAEVEYNRSREEAVRLREQLDKFKADKQKLENALEECRHDLETAREAERRLNQRLNETSRELQRTQEELNSKLEDQLKIEELTRKNDVLIARNKNLEESRDELQAAAAAFQAGRELLMPSEHDPNDNTINRRNSPNLATELLLTGTALDQTDAAGLEASAADNCDNFTSIAEAKKALKEQREVNARLRLYIDNILLNIVENYPQLLEVKQPHE